MDDINIACADCVRIGNPCVTVMRPIKSSYNKKEVIEWRPVRLACAQIVDLEQIQKDGLFAVSFWPWKKKE